MSWFKIDDGFHCHPKVFAAGTPAVGLYVRCGSWAAQQVTDGIVPKHVAKMYGTPRMIKALVDAGLWHQKGHDCESCPELDANSYAIHQYLERNPSRVETELARKSKSERQQRWREGKRKQQVSENDDPDVDGDVDASTRRHGDAAPVPTPPVPSQVPPTEVPPPPSPSGTQPGAEVVPLSGRGEVQPLIEAMAARGMTVSWSFQAAEWLELRDAIRRAGVPALVDHAARAWQAAKTQPYSAKYFLRGWTGLQEQPAYTGPRPVGAPSKTTEYLEDMAAIAEELRQKKGTA
ncbi:hypothetical protein MQE23_08665 [Streptomyces sp. HP-A2021]|uniref:hypothetical protein n=1 Tax=Streptomyces sp. HP-A2021 TaxID=2927875 RepID=UPI001FAEFD53|nr:hypothetical protein [Streptomyces sp. HP-A2021]UOB09124.1 hypothetical protein MQE23_08665 [Streptomyces sp. HP-A2021]